MIWVMLCNYMVNIFTQSQQNLIKEQLQAFLNWRKITKYEKGIEIFKTMNIKMTEFEVYQNKLIEIMKRNKGTYNWGKETHS